MHTKITGVRTVADLLLPVSFAFHILLLCVCSCISDYIML